MIDVVSDAPGERVVQVRLKHTRPDEKWRGESDVLESERKSNESWSSMDDENRAALVLIVTDVLKRMLEDPNEWVPTSMEISSGNKLDIWIGMDFDDIDDEVVRRRHEVEKDIRATRQDIMQMQAELRDA